MSNKKKKHPAQSGSASAAGQQQEKKNTNGIGGIIIGVAVALIVFSFSGFGESKTSNWVESVGTIVSSYTITEEENKDEAGIYADVEFVDNNTGATRTERSMKLESELTDYVGKSMEIKYNPTGEGVSVVGFTASTASMTNLLISFAIIIVVFAVGEAFKKMLPTQEEYNKRRAAKKQQQ